MGHKYNLKKYNIDNSITNLLQTSPLKLSLIYSDNIFPNYMIRQIHSKNFIAERDAKFPHAHSYCGKHTGQKMVMTLSCQRAVATILAKTTWLFYFHCLILGTTRIHTKSILRILSRFHGKSASAYNCQRRMSAKFAKRNLRQNSNGIQQWLNYHLLYQRTWFADTNIAWYSIKLETTVRQNGNQNAVIDSLKWAFVKDVLVDEGQEVTVMKWLF